jgi:hypothetical protein
MVGCRSAVLTGAAAASLLGLDGFRDREWRPLWCAPRSVRRRPGLIRVRNWRDPQGAGVAHVALVLRHLGEHAAELGGFDGLTARDRIELAVEHALRDSWVTLDELRESNSRALGDVLLRDVLDLRGDEPAAESYSEVRAIQVLRAAGLGCWRQYPIYERRRLKHRVDLVIPFDQRVSRPELLRPHHGLLLEVDSREFHEGKFEQDHQRQTTYDLLGFAWTTITPNQIRDSPGRVVRALQQRLASACRPQGVETR